MRNGRNFFAMHRLTPGPYFVSDVVNYVLPCLPYPMTDVIPPLCKPAESETHTGDVRIPYCAIQIEFS